MPRLISNRPNVVQGLFALGQAFNLRRRVAGRKRLGDEMIDAATGVIVERTVRRQSDPTGAPLKPLSRRYRLRKMAQGYPGIIAVRTGEMMDPEQVRGRTIVSDHAASMTAGLDDETIRKVAWFQEGARPRPFYDLGKDGETAVDAVCLESREQSLREAYDA
jgi:hypothetical protein